jgi:hypothetical protein
MAMILATYLPFFRVHEIELFFLKNISIIKPKFSIIYIDQVFNNKQIELLRRVLPEGVEVRFGNWRNRNDTWIAMLTEFLQAGVTPVVVVDSDNVVDEIFLTLHEKLAHNPIYTVLDEESWQNGAHAVLSRSRLIGDINGKPVYAYKVFDGRFKNILRGGPPFFIGPKQVVVISKLPPPDLLNSLQRALSRVDAQLRNLISDETLLGIMAYAMGIREVPWVVASHHHHHGSAPSRGKVSELLTAIAHYQFAKSVARELRLREIRLYRLKYMISILHNLKSIP